jgi:homoserine dehydrogenase
MNKSVGVGLVGFGTVGSGVYRLLEQNADIIQQRTGINVALKIICDLDTERLRSQVTGVRTTSDWKEVVESPDVDIVVELIGGIEPARTILLAAAAKGKHMVTANKKLLAEAGSEILEKTSSGSPDLGFEASVCGGIPCILALRSGLVGNRVKSVMGILNGTTNYILTMMQDEGLSFEDALRDAQKKGFAEADPTFDVEGFDAGHKIAILSMLAYNRSINYKSITIEGITGIGTQDIDNAREMGYVIKLLGISKWVDGQIDIRVHPTMLPSKHPLAPVRNEFNAVMFNSDMTGPVTFNGKGAGSLPTASAVVSDIVRIAGGQSYRKGTPGTIEPAAYLAPEKRQSRYYIRVHTEDRPGILSRIAGVLAHSGISISSVIQKESNMPHVPLVIMTHRASEAGMLNAIREIGTFPFVEGKPTLIRVEDNNQDGE